MPPPVIDRVRGDAPDDRPASRHGSNSSSSGNHRGPVMGNFRPTLNGENESVHHEKRGPDGTNSVKKIMKTMTWGYRQTVDSNQGDAHNEDEEVEDVMEYAEYGEKQEGDQDAAHEENERVEEEENDEMVDDDDETEDDRDIEAKLPVERTQLSKVTQARQRKGAPAPAQQEPKSRAQGRSTRTHGRAAKSSIGAGSKAKSVTSFNGPKKTQGKRKRDSTEDGPRRSLRTAAKLSTQPAAEPKRAKTSSTQSRSKNTKALDSGAKQTRAMKRTTPTKARAKPEYEVQLILDARGSEKSGTREYLVKWKGYHVKKSTWEPAANLTHCTEALNEWRSE